jgi:hypothetical protein
LLAARHAPGGPELQVDRLLAVELGEIDLFAVQGRQLGGWGGLADQRAARALGTTIAFGVVAIVRVGELCGAQQEQQGGKGL